MSAFCSKYPECGCVGIGTKCYTPEEFQAMLKKDIPTNGASPMSLNQGTGASNQNSLSNQWVSVKNGLPDDLEDVLATNIECGGIEKCYYSYEDKKWFPSDASENFERLITHWMPLPPTPPIDK